MFKFIFYISILAVYFVVVLNHVVFKWIQIFSSFQLGHSEKINRSSFLCRLFLLVKLLLSFFIDSHNLYLKFLSYVVDC